MTKDKVEELELKGEGSKPSELTRPTPDVEADFTALLKDYGVQEKAAGIITRHVADTGSARVFETPMELLEKLAKFPRQIPPVTRKNILDHWIAQNKIPVPEGYEEEAEKPAEDIRRRLLKGEKEEAKYSVDTETGQIKVASTSDKAALTWDEAEKLSKNIEGKIAEREQKSSDKAERKASYVFDPETGQVRMAKEGEMGGTLEQAKELKKMAADVKKVEEEPRWITTEAGDIVPNPKSTFAGADMMVWDMYKEAKQKGEAGDPLEYMEAQSQRIERLQKIFGSRQGQTSSVDQLKTLLELQQMLGAGSKSDDTLVTKMTALEKRLEDMQEERHRQELAAQTAQITDLRTMVVDLVDKIGKMKQPVTGRTEMDIIHEVATDTLGVLKTELPGLRSDIREAVGGGALRTSKTPEEREQRKVEVKEALEKDKKLEELGKRLFFREKTGEAPKGTG